ncbi:hypothetical protein MGYG_05387 [Nannizzia gypsea CBS 118893]|uniref:Uncharacterized protein n=1 Tax=Arthroderma gypseum (strain ATCC MYA-4604 / CBS 118893) TaxID=535722 RepID=E4UVR4_ARTGP|nr:hypothetical protein MGYG_05387 [Nannizzia gypsea CBS 118893]EFR02391.1 hypothetical protein MGYG_05387 [Nannizzia gypsea CBS 118893]
MDTQGFSPGSAHEPIQFMEGKDPQTTIIDLADLLKRTVDERNASRRCLLQALKTITDLKFNIEEHRSIIMESQAALAECTRKSSSYLSFLMAVEPRWIQDTWVSFPANETLLGVVEYKWARGESQRALNELCLLRKRLSSGGPDWVQTLLLEGAILFSSGQHTEARLSVSDVLWKCTRIEEQNPSVIRDFRDIAHFLLGKIFMAEEKWIDACREFAEVIHVLEYRTRALQLKTLSRQKSNQKRKPDSLSASTFRDDESTGLVVD